MSLQSSSFCLILPITCPQSLWNLKLAKKLHVNDKIRDLRQTNMSPEHYFWSRLQNSPYFCVFQYAQAVKQQVWNEAENRERVRLARFACIRLLRHSLPISLLILRKKNHLFCSLFLKLQAVGCKQLLGWTVFKNPNLYLWHLLLLLCYFTLQAFYNFLIWVNFVTQLL